MSGGSPCTVGSKLNKFEDVHVSQVVTELGQGVPVWAVGRAGGSLYRGLGPSQVQWVSLYGEVQCIMGNGRIGPPIDRQT